MKLMLYLSQILGARILLCWLVLLILAVGIDLLRTASDLVARGGVALLAEYALLRAPLLGAILIPISVLAGGLMGFFTLSTRSEIAVIRATGLSIWRVLAMLVPLAVLLGLAYNVMGDRLSVAAEQRLADLFPLETTPDPSGSTAKPFWNRGSREILRAIPAASDGSALVDLTIYELGSEGTLARRITAASAKFTGDGWQLREVVIDHNGQPQNHAVLDWKSLLTPSDIFRIAKGQGAVSSGQAQAVLSGDAAPTRGRPFYETQIARGYVAFAVPLIMLVLAAPAAFASARQTGGAGAAVLAIALGFLYVATDGFTASLARVGGLDPWLAALVPSGLFLIAGIWLLLLKES
ncbi:MAG: LptF/LptG family permease [Pseudomonadota bacterium]